MPTRPRAPTQNADGTKSPGFILAPRSAVQNRVLCSYPTDSGTVFIKCLPLGGGPGSVYNTGPNNGPPEDDDGQPIPCVAGCSPMRCGVDPPWRTCGYDTCQECSYHGGSGLKQMMEAHDVLRPAGMQSEWGYNEVVIGAADMAPLVPASAFLCARLPAR